ncbi:MAG: dihydrodipicolinate synthase family protein [Saprospiraceae bacterium]|nr:dihydrodipicolinate synthase family protein [Saprospiraceae bacterium]
MYSTSYDCSRGDGVTSVMANALPKASIQPDDQFCARSGLLCGAGIKFKTYDLHKWLYIEGNPVGIKSAMEILGYGTNEVRLPLSPLSDGNYAKLKEELMKIVKALDIG